MKFAALALAAAAMIACAGCARARPAAAADAGASRDRVATANATYLDANRDIVLAVADPRVPPPTRAGSSLLGYVPPVHYAGAGLQAARTLAALKRTYGWLELEGWPIKALDVYCIVLRPLQGADRAALLAQLARDDRVQLAEPLRSFSVYSSGSLPAHQYNDPYVGLERGFIDTDAALAHAFSQGEGVDVAVVDTGVDAAHPDLRGRIRGVHDEVDHDPSARDRDHHGTEVAGIIAAVANNHIGIVGMAPKATLSIYKACWYPTEPGAGARCNSFTLAKALAAVLDNRDARIVNMSLGGPPDPLLAKLLEKLLGEGRIVVAAMPPDGELNGFPDNVPGVIVVRASAKSTDPPGVLSAPGRDILTTQSDGGYDFVSGSSMAAAHVSGIAALLLSISPDMHAQALHDLLQRTSRISAGVLQVNAAAAVAAVRHPAASRHE